MKNKINRLLFGEKMQADGHQSKQVFEIKKARVSWFLYKNKTSYSAFVTTINGIML